MQALLEEFTIGEIMARRIRVGAYSRYKQGRRESVSAHTKTITTAPHRYRYWLEAIPNAYGFGRDYVLYVTDGVTTKKFWLGQGVKVHSRLLGLSDAPSYYEKKYGTREWDKIKGHLAKDIILASFGESEGDITTEMLKKIMGAAPWELSVE